MTDALAPKNLPTLSPENVALGRESWLAAGFDPAVYDAAAAGEPLASNGSPKISAAELERERQNFEGGMRTGKRAITPEQVAVGIADARAAGMSDAQIKAILGDDVNLAPIPEDTRTYNERQFDDFFRPAAPNDIKISWMGRLDPSADTAALAELNGALTGWASEIGWSAEVAGGVLEEAIDAGHRYSGMSEGGQALYRQEEVIAFERLCGGPEKAAERRTLATEALKRGGKNTTLLLHNSGALHSAHLIASLANLEEARQRRAKGL